MANGGRRLVVGFGYGVQYCGWAATANVVNYEIKRRLGEYESTFVDSAGPLAHVVVAASPEDAVSLRDRLNHEPFEVAGPTAVARGLPKPKVDVLRIILDAAWATYQSTGETNATLRDLVWPIVDANQHEVEQIRSALSALAAPAPAPPAPAWPPFDDFPFAAVIFDLDQTLVDSSLLGSPEARRAWAKGGRDDGRVRELEVDGTIRAHEFPALLAERNIPVGIATRAPQQYAERVLELLEIHHDVALGGPGDKSAKVRACAAHLGVEASSVVVVGDDASDFLAAREVGAWSLGALWAPERWPDRIQPDIACSEPELLLNVPDWTRLAFLAEQPLAAEPFVHTGSWIRIGSGTTHALGRYFRSGSPFHDDQLTQTVLASKRRSAPDAVIARALRLVAQQIGDGLPIDLVASVPSENGRIDRFERYRDVVADMVGAESDQPLRVVRKVSGYKRMTHETRHAVSRGRFSADSSVADLHVLVVDDVTTSGATLAACEAALRDAGAAEVSTLAFAATQD